MFLLNRLLIFFDGVECLSFELNDLEDEDSAAALETRLNAVAPHATKVFHFHRQPPCSVVFRYTCVAL